MVRVIKFLFVPLATESGELSMLSCCYFTINGSIIPLHTNCFPIHRNHDHNNTETILFHTEAMSRQAETVLQHTEAKLRHVEAVLRHPEAMLRHTEAKLRHTEAVLRWRRTSSALRTISSVFSGISPGCITISSVYREFYHIK